jgi:energy-coupling factor transporter ATP-binding protein EcfA2
MAANDLMRRFYNTFDPFPLEPDQKDLYVDLEEVRGSGHAIEQIAKRIDRAQKPTCSFVAGHRGSGKSTELIKLKQILEKPSETTGEKKYVVYCEADDDLDRNDIDFPDILISIVKNLAESMEKDFKVSLNPGYFKERLGEFKDFLLQEISFDDFKLAAVFGELSGVIKHSPNTRKKLRKMLEPGVSSLQYAANEIIGDAQKLLIKKGYSGIVIIVDDLDKMIIRQMPDSEYTTAENLFINREAQIQGFHCQMVYTMPLALCYSIRGEEVKSLYGGSVPVIPMVKVIKRDGNKNTSGYEKLMEMVHARLLEIGISPEETFESKKVLDKIIELSGGQPRELMMLVRDASIEEDLPIKLLAVKRVTLNTKRAYARQLLEEHWNIIEEIRQDHVPMKNEKNEKIFRELLGSRALLQYVNDEEWLAVNPLVPERP